MTQSRTIKIKRGIRDVVDSLKSGKKRGEPCSVLIGAGCSVTAGIPLARNIEKRIKEDHESAYDRAEKKTYPYLMGELDTGPRYDLIAEYVEKSKLNWAHLLLGYLVDQGYVGRILTTNFDNLTLRALSLYHCFPSVYDLAISTRFDADLVRDPSVFFLHGQHGGFVQLHTHEDVKDHAIELAPAFQDASLRRTWLVVGYSGDNDPVFENLAGRKFNNALYWVGYKKNEPSETVKKRLLSRENHAYWVEGYDADSFFHKLCQELYLDLPPLLVDPFSHQLKILEKFQPYTEAEERKSYDFLKRPKKKLLQAKRCLIDNVPDCPKEEERKKEEELVKEVRNLYFKGQYKEAVEMLQGVPQPLSDEVKELHASALTSWGDSLGDRAESLQGPEAEAMWNEACEKYATALEIKPDKYDALYNWGVTLLRKTKMRQNPEADTLLDAAFEKYTTALETKPHTYEVLFNCGLTLAYKAKTIQGPEADALWEETFEKYAAAVKIKPNKHEALLSWAVALSDKAETKHGAEANALWDKACEKYTAALEIRPEDHEVFNNWGVTLSNKAKAQQDIDIADILLDEACQKFNAALEIKPNDYEALFNLGTTLFDKAELKQGAAETDSLREKAYRKYIAALKIKADYYDVLYNLGCLFASKSDAETAINWLEKCKQVSDPPLTQKEIAGDPDFDAIRDDPRFQEFVASLHPE